jgi:chorismate dehydratase
MLFLCSANLIQLKKIKVGAVTYLNTKPLIYGMQQESFLKYHELILSYPAKLAEMLKKGELDVALVPVALLPELPEYHIVSDYCIASDHEVASVCLFSEKPLSEIKRVYLDYQSKTSVALLKILFKQYWKQEVEWLAATSPLCFRICAIVMMPSLLQERRLFWPSLRTSCARKWVLAI